MSISPSNPDPVGGAKVGRGGKGAPVAPPRQARVLPLRPESKDNDSIEISPTAADLQQTQAPAATGAEEISSERLQEILGRIREGFYKSPEIRSVVAQRLWDAIQRS